MAIQRVAVLGAGLMGHGIAQICAQIPKWEVNLLDAEQRFLDQGLVWIRDSLSRFERKGRVTAADSQATLTRIHPSLDLAAAVRDVDLVIEAVPEDTNIKRQVWQKVAQHAASHTVFASNTSSISITLLGRFVGPRAPRLAGMHFFNPPQLMPLVEVIRGEHTSDATIQIIQATAKQLAKETVLVLKDMPGFIVNRVLVPALNEACYLVEEGVATPEDIDKAIQLGLNWPMGPLRLLDYVGLDTTLAIADYFVQEFHDSKYRPAPLLRRMVRAGKLGRKTGQGFYTWPPGA